MTAPIVGHVTRFTYPRLGLLEPTDTPIEGDGYMATKYTDETVKGQLWEREAERSIYDPETGEYSSRFSYILFTARRTPGPHMRAVSGVIIAGTVREHTK